MIVGELPELDRRHPRIIAVDWSGASHRPRLAWAEAGQPPELMPSRDAVCDRLLSIDGPVVVGLDFSFSLPDWCFAEFGIGTVEELWSAPVEDWLRSCRPPFWGRPGKPRPHPHEDGFRVTEWALAPRPRSTLQIGGAGSVGTGSLRGWSTLARLRRDGGFAIWPFDAPTDRTVVEVWPRLAIGATRKEQPGDRGRWLVVNLPDLASSLALESTDAFDAVAAAHALRIACSGGFPVPGPAARREGWIYRTTHQQSVH